MSAGRLPSNQRQVNLFVRHHGDVAAGQVVERLHSLTRSGAADAFLVVVVTPGGESWQCSLATANDVVETDLLDALSAVRVLERVRMVGVLCATPSEDLENDLRQGLGHVRRRLEQTRGRQTQLVDLRVQALAADERLSRQAIFSPGGLNVALVPQDRASDLGSARLVRREGDNERFLLHIATELATITGLWAPMAGAPVDEWRHQPSNSDELQVRFSRSLVRALFCPPLPLDRVVTPGESLPVPTGFQPSPNVAATVGAVTRATFPDALRFEPHYEHLHQVDIPWNQAIRAIPRRIADIVKSLPRVLRNGISRDLESLAGDGIQSMIGADSWLRVTFRDRQDAIAPGQWQTRAEDSIAELEMLDEMPMMADLPPNLWSDVIAGVFGIADGSNVGAAAREASGEQRFLVTQPWALTSNPQESPADTVRSLLDEIEGATRQVESAAPQTDQTVDSASTSDGGFQPPFAPPVVEMGESGEVVAGGETSDSDSTIESEASAPSPEKLPTPQRSRISEALAQSSRALPAGGLVGAITDQFVEEKQRADQRLLEMYGRMASLVTESGEASGDMAVPKLVRFLLALAAMAFVFAITVFTGLAKFTDFHWLSFGWRAAVWLVLSAAVAGSALLVLGERDTHGRLRTAGMSILLGAAAVVAYHPSIRHSVPVSKSIGQRYWPMWPLSTAVVIVGLTARNNTPHEVGKWRSALARFVGWLTCAYLVLILVASGSNSNSFLQPASRATPNSLLRVVHITGERRRQLLILICVAAAVVFFGGVLRIAFLWIRIEYRNRVRGEQFQFANGEAIRSSRERRRLMVLTSQWLGSATAISRIIWSPLGPIGAPREMGRDSLVDSNDLLKFDFAEMDLTSRGDAMMLARLRSILVRPGWLINQYQRAADSFMASDPVLLDAEATADERPTPETCPAVVPLEEVLAGRATGRRWDFAEALYSGYLDEALRKVITENQPEKLFESVLRDPTAHRTIGAIDEDADLLTFFEGILPVGTQELPAGLSRTVFTASDPRRSMESFVAWPQEFVPREIHHAHEIESKASGIFEGAVILAARLDVSMPFKLSEVSDFDFSESDHQAGVDGDTSPDLL